MLYLQNTDEREAYLRFVTRAVHTDTYEGFLALLRTELKAILPFGAVIAGAGSITPNQTVKAHKLISVDFPMEYLNAIATPDGGFISPTMIDWIQTRAPQLFEDEQTASAEPPADWIASLRRYGLRNLACHGVHDFAGDCTSYFAFANLTERLGERHSCMLKVVVPMLHAVFIKIMADVPDLNVDPARYPRSQKQ